MRSPLPNRPNELSSEQDCFGVTTRLMSLARSRACSNRKRAIFSDKKRWSGRSRCGAAAAASRLRTPCVPPTCRCRPWADGIPRAPRCSRAHGPRSGEPSSNISSKPRRCRRTARKCGTAFSLASASGLVPPRTTAATIGFGFSACSERATGCRLSPPPFGARARRALTGMAFFPPNRQRMASDRPGPSGSARPGSRTLTQTTTWAAKSGGFPARPNMPSCRPKPAPRCRS